ncbi:Spy/CpxP family protein refolding chaperone [Bradyrhizobium lablabi]|uniref:Spy/CpxP family protein refolding chaperone n=1 Tax=Bradyrhizobium lablabi TaxID=722472 RepID=UPI001BAAF328|nr:Spy/CpxP family protein refolding chaperone [Bradyrhizobium lablabi]MBR1121044.1 Spy/CpxP family protein refolding chaperone [Bradyrhizobium lablabi]
MPKWPIGIAVALLTILPSSEAFAGIRIGVSPIGVARLAVGRVLSLGRPHHVRRHAHYRHARMAGDRSRNVRRAMASGVTDPAARKQIAAVAALAGWNNGRASGGWWEHDDGGYGWVGPMFWPFAIYDVYDYAMWGDGTGFWSYGYPDIHAAIFTPYSRTELAAYTGSRPAGRRYRKVPLVAQLCGDDSRLISEGLIGQLQQTVQPGNEAQRAALEDLATALITAGHMIRATCPAHAALSAPERLTIMQHRIGVMIKAQSTVQPALIKFYDLLDQEQEARLKMLAEDRRKMDAPARACSPAQPAPLRWPDEIGTRLRLNDTQRAAFKALQDANGTAREILSACPPDDTTTPPARLDAVEGRLNAMQQAVYLVNTALGEFYETLSDEQKAQFEAIGQKRAA